MTFFAHLGLTSICWKSGRASQTTTRLWRIDCSTGSSARYRCSVKIPMPDGQGRNWLQNLRSFPVGNYILHYRPLPGSIQLVRVRSGFMDIDSDDMR